MWLSDKNFCRGPVGALEIKECVVCVFRRVIRRMWSPWSWKLRYHGPGAGWFSAHRTTIWSTTPNLPNWEELHQVQQDWHVEACKRSMGELSFLFLNATNGNDNYLAAEAERVNRCPRVLPLKKQLVRTNGWIWLGPIINLKKFSK